MIINPYRAWAYTHRPKPDNVNFVTHYEKGKYDFALLHIDQQSIYDPEKNDRISKGLLYVEINRLVQDIPKIVINHMTPFHDKYETDYVVKVIKDLIGDNHMICNSHTARKQWGWGHTIIHGLDVDEWWNLPKEPRAIIVLSPAGMNKAYRRTFAHSVVRILKERDVPITWVGSDMKFNSFEKYRDYIGRSLVHFFPAWQSPMPRARTEAMLSGSCIVTTPYQDADTFIEDGVNGYLTSKSLVKDPRIMDSPEYSADLIENLVMHDPQLAIKIGEAGRKTARKKFNSKVFAKQWEEYLISLGILS